MKYKKMSSKELKERYSCLMIREACYGVDTLEERNKISRILKKKKK